MASPRYQSMDPQHLEELWQEVQTLFLRALEEKRGDLERHADALTVDLDEAAGWIADQTAAEGLEKWHRVTGMVLQVDFLRREPLRAARGVLKAMAADS